MPPIQQTPAQARTTQAAAHVAELKSTLERVLAAVAAGRTPDPEDVVTLRGTTEQLIEAAEQPLPLPLFQLEDVRVPQAQWEANGDKPNRTADDWRCLVCNRPVNPNSKTAWWVHMSEQGNLYPHGTDEDQAREQEGDMGCHPVGSECATKVPRAYRWRNQ